MVRVDASGRKIILYVASAGELFAEAALFSPVYRCDALTKTGATVRLYPKAKVLSAFRQNPQAAEVFMAILAREIMHLRTRLEARNIRSGRGRVRHFLGFNTGTGGGPVLLH